MLRDFAGGTWSGNIRFWALQVLASHGMVPQEVAGASAAALHPVPPGFRRTRHACLSIALARGGRRMRLSMFVLRSKTRLGTTGGCTDRISKVFPRKERVMSLTAIATDGVVALRLMDGHVNGQAFSIFVLKTYFPKCLRSARKSHGDV